MTIRLRYYLAILPLFIGLSVFNGLLVFYLDRSEIRWGLEQRAKGSAAVVVGFRDSLDSATPEIAEARMRAFSNRLGGLGIVWLEPSGDGWNTRQLLQTEGIELPPPPPDLSQRLQASGLTSILVESADAGHDLNLGYAADRNAAGELIGVVAVAEADRSLRDATRSLIQRLLTLTALALLGGVLVTEWLTRYAKRELGSLGAAARELASGRYLSHWPTGRIRELNDLGGTLLTMTSLLSDGSNQTRRRFFEAEQLPGDSELAACLRELSMGGDLPAELARRCAWRCIGPPVLDEFIGYRRDLDGFWLIAGLGKRPANAVSELQRCLHAAAARDYLLQLGASRPDPAAWRAALNLFPCLNLQLIFLPHDDRPGEAWRLDAQHDVPVAWDSDLRFTLLGTLPEEALKLADDYERQFPDRALEQMMAELSGLLTAHYRGILVVCETTINVTAAIEKSA